MEQLDGLQRRLVHLDSLPELPLLLLPTLETEPGQETTGLVVVLGPAGEETVVPEPGRPHQELDIRHSPPAKSHILGRDSS